MDVYVWTSDTAAGDVCSTAHVEMQKNIHPHIHTNMVDPCWQPLITQRGQPNLEDRLLSACWGGSRDYEPLYTLI